MPLFVCKDPMTNALRDLLPAFHLIRVPESSILPLVVLTKHSGIDENTLTRIGPLSDLIREFPEPEVQDSQMADLSGKKTNDVKIDVGLKIVSGFLSGFGVNAPALTAAFQNVKTLSFSFENVHHLFVDKSKLGNIFIGRPVDLTNPAIAVVHDNGRCFVIDSIVVSNNFSVKAEKTTDANFVFNLGDVENVLATADQKVVVKATAEKTIQFKGEKQLAFAFTCVELFFDENNNVTKFLSVKPDKQSVGFGLDGTEEDTVLETQFKENLEMLDVVIDR